MNFIKKYDKLYAKRKVQTRLNKIILNFVNI